MVLNIPWSYGRLVGLSDISRFIGHIKSLRIEYGFRARVGDSALTCSLLKWAW